MLFAARYIGRVRWEVGLVWEIRVGLVHVSVDFRRRVVVAYRRCFLTRILDLRVFLCRTPSRREESREQTSVSGVQQLRFMSDIDIQIPGVFDPFAEANADDSGAGSKDYVHVRVQQRNGRKSLTTVQGLKKEFNYNKILKDFKKVSGLLLCYSIRVYLSLV